MKKSEVTQSCPTLCNPIDYTYCPWNSPGQSTGVGNPFPSPGDLPNPGIKPKSTTLQTDSLLSEPPGKPRNTGGGCYSLHQGIFLTQESNWGPSIESGFFTSWATKEAKTLTIFPMSIQKLSIVFFLFFYQISIWKIAESFLEPHRTLHGRMSGKGLLETFPNSRETSSSLIERERLNKSHPKGISSWNSCLCC